MRRIFIGLVLLFVLMAGFISCAQSSKAADASQQNRIDVYYLHGNFRCSTCFKIEQYSREAVESNFKDELASGKVTFKAINTEERGNEHFINDYQLYTKSLILSLVQDGKEAKYINLTKVWDYIGNKQKFFDYVKNEVSVFLKEL